MMLRTHTQTAGSTLTLQQPENNIVRAAVQALAAALGGVQSMALSCFDEAIAIPTQHAQTLAVRTQQMLQHEFGITDVADPLGGSWYVEQLTDAAGSRGAAADRRRSTRWAARWRRSRRASTSGDRRRGLRQGAADRPGEDVVVGVNAFVGRAPRALPERFDVPAAARRDQRRRLERLRAAARRRRGAGGAGGARGRQPPAMSNLMPAIVDAVRADATLGEICARAARACSASTGRRRRCRSDHGGSAPVDGGCCIILRR